jgi:hypothetical protein
MNDDYQEEESYDYYAINDAAAYEFQQEEEEENQYYTYELVENDGEELFQGQENYFLVVLRRKVEEKDQFYLH